MSLRQKKSNDNPTDHQPAMLDAFLDLARRGRLVVPLYGIREDGCCECHRGGKCDSPGKHPRIKGWPAEATRDEAKIEKWVVRWPLLNLGAKSGPESGAIDVECDSDEAEAALVELFGGPENFPVVPTYTSGRGKHRQFAWSAELAALPESGKAVFVFRGIEFRIGGGGKGGQSVYPPSRHKSGCRYAWLPGLSLDDVELQPLPAGVMATLLREGGRTEKAERPSTGPAPSTNGAAPLPENVEAAGGDDRSPRHRLYDQEHVLETIDERDKTIHAEACALWGEQGRLVGKKAFEDPAVQVLVFERLMGLNVRKCRPPLDEATVRVKVESAKKFIKDQQTRSPKDDRQVLTLAELQEYRVRVKEDVWEVMFAGLDVRNTHVRKIGRKGGDYYWELEDGRKIHLGTAADLMNPRKCQAAIVDATTVAIRIVTFEQWRPIGQAIAAAAVVEDIGDGPEEQLRRWISSYVGKGAPENYDWVKAELVDLRDRLRLIGWRPTHDSIRHDLEPWKLMRERSYDERFLWDAGHLHIHLPSFAMYLSHTLHLQVKEGELRKTARLLGFESCPFSVRYGKGDKDVKSGSVWRSEKPFDLGTDG
jgi:hypothetical protein